MEMFVFGPNVLERRRRLDRFSEYFFPNGLLLFQTPFFHKSASKMAPKVTG
jgi:hypothetical protein